MNRLIIGILVLNFSIFLSCSNNTREIQNTRESQTGFVRVDGRTFRDAMNRELILNGINLIVKDPARGYTCAIPESDFLKVKEWGFNVIRLGIIWDGLEPEPGVYNEEMFRCIDERIRMASEQGYYVMLDMHQDLYSVKYSDGAPEWATLTDKLPHQTGEVWSDAYLISPAVQTAFDHFWNNTPASDGLGIQDHYADLWKKIAERYADEPAVIGYDIMNEPFIGTQAQAFFPAMVEAYIGIYAEEIQAAGMQVEEVAGMWSTPEGRAQVLENLIDTAKYSKVVCAVQEMNQAFESTILMDMYTLVASAIREVDENHILFVEHSYFSNPGVPSGLKRIVYADGTSEMNMAYTPHGYDLLVDTDAYKNASKDRVEYLFNLCQQTAIRLDMPMLVGEWGAFHGMDSSYVHQTRSILQKFDEFKCGQTFWARYKGMEEHPFFNELIRPAPLAVAGDIQAYSYDHTEGVFKCTWLEGVGNKHVSEFILPRVKAGKDMEISLSPPETAYRIVERENAPGLVLTVEATGKENKRELKLTF